jgi:hypothetical protein
MRARRRGAQHGDAGLARHQTAGGDVPEVEVTLAVGVRLAGGDRAEL